MRVALIAIAALALSGCSGTWLDVPVQRAEAPASPESYYQFLVSSSDMVRVLRAKFPGAALQVSPLRRSVAPQPGDWTACLRIVESGKRPRFTAFFIMNREIIDYRSSVAIDRCEANSYGPLARN